MDIPGYPTTVTKYDLSVDLPTILPYWKWDPGGHTVAVPDLFSDSRTAVHRLLDLASDLKLVLLLPQNWKWLRMGVG